MYLVEKLLGQNSSDAIAIDFDDYCKLFDSRKFVTYLDKLKELRGLPSSVLADLSATIIAQLWYRRSRTGLSDAVLLESLEYCTSLIDNQGFRLTNIDNLKRSAQPDKDHVMLVAGCQGRVVRNSRADAAVKLLQQIQNVPFKVVCCGSSPFSPAKRVTVRTSDEATDMKNWISTQINGDPKFEGRRNFRIDTENKSTSTELNIKNFFTNPQYFDETDPAQVYLVSSTFHLPRLAKLAETYLEKMKKKNIEKLILVGAESPHSLTDVVRDQRYVKAMMFEVYNDMFCRYKWPPPQDVEAVAWHIVELGGDTTAKRVELAFRLCASRKPTTDEFQSVCEFCESFDFPATPENDATTKIENSKNGDEVANRIRASKWESVCRKLLVLDQVDVSFSVLSKLV